MQGREIRMLPKPQDVLALPPDPNLDQYNKLAKELVKACKSRATEAIREWTSEWVHDPTRLSLDANDVHTNDGRLAREPLHRRGA